ncbi:hypothetical protein SLEP1_g25368 [Rubroshorea leprosula]|uniref:Ubiquitin-like protease family profile domain-containing protein n=1 Tax=Rubroshorea leprosula TaxID=152421 RepID=A0AAV5JPU8_9ROSI|nr:hypothetical protein SLEP1_g25368 [Rubroshorea leprosula]
MEGGLQVDLSELVSSVDEDPLPVEIIKSDKRQRREQPETMNGDEEPKEDFSTFSDHNLEDSIQSTMHTIRIVGSKLSDKGEKLIARIKCLEDEKERRRQKVDIDGWKKPLKSMNSNIADSSDGSKKEYKPSPAFSQSTLGACFIKKMEENKGCRIIKSFDKNPTLNSREHQKKRGNMEFFWSEGQKGQSSSKRRNMHPPRKHSLNGYQQHAFSHSDQKGRASSFCSLHNTVDDQPRFDDEKKKAFQAFQATEGLGSKTKQTFVVVDDDELLLGETTQEEAKLPEIAKDARIYYPSRDDPDPVEICFGDIDNLAPEAYLTSTIINFYIRFLQHQASPTNREICDCYFFNTFFYKKLTEAVSDKGSNKFDFGRFRRWWRGVNIFQKAYVLIPIHEDLHWSLVIICIPNKEDESGPIMLHLDSLGLHSSSLVFYNIRSFLEEEWNYLKQEVAPSDLPIGDKVWSQLPSRINEKKIQVPQQKNDSDCGLFVLYFMKRFIEEAPERLRKRDLVMFGKSWFIPEEASGLRRKIRNILIEQFQSAATEYPSFRTF